MSDAATVIVGVTSVLSCVALLTWIGRPSEFRTVRAARPPRLPKPKAAPRAPEPVWVSPLPPEATAPVATPDAALVPAVAAKANKRRRHAPARSFLVVTKAPSRR